LSGSGSKLLSIDKLRIGKFKKQDLILVNKIEKSILTGLKMFGYL